MTGGVSGFVARNRPEEDEVLAREESLLDARYSDGLARLRVKIWGDGPLQRKRRADDE